MGAPRFYVPRAFGAQIVTVGPAAGLLSSSNFGIFFGDRPVDLRVVCLFANFILAVFRDFDFRSSSLNFCV